MPRKNFRHLSEQVRRDPARAAQVDALKAEMLESMGLGELRRNRGRTQTGLARDLGRSQARISAIERQGDVTLSTLERYVAALGGRLEVRAVFDDETIQLAPAPGERRSRR